MHADKDRRNHSSYDSENETERGSEGQMTPIRQEESACLSFFLPLHFTDASSLLSSAASACQVHPLLLRDEFARGSNAGEVADRPTVQFRISAAAARAHRLSSVRPLSAW